MEEQEFKGRTAIVTGGGRGFGKAFGHALAARGAQAVLADIDAQASADAAAEIRAAGGAATGIACDVADEGQVAAMVRQVVETHGGIDILINNAGLHSHAYSRPLADLGLDGLRRLFNVNIMGVAICSLTARPAMQGRPGAAIVNISSSAAYDSGTAYGVSKLAVRGLTITTAREFAPDGIRVNAIAPGIILTDTIRRELPPDTVKRVMSQQFLTREGTEQDIVEAMLYLVSARSAFITGETIRVTGGYSTWI